MVVHAIALESVALPDLTLRVRCGKGTYVRTLAGDLGAALGCGATVAALGYVAADTRDKYLQREQQQEKEELIRAIDARF